jgi:hypothetical protein
MRSLKLAVADDERRYPFVRRWQIVRHRARFIWRDYWTDLQYLLRG